MSNAAALAATTQMLRSVLLDATSTLWARLGSTPVVSAVPPDRIASEDGDQLNVFLYRQSLNPGWRNSGLPVRGADATRLTQPPLALDLHYVISAHCKVDLHAELLMGAAMEALHGMSMLTAKSISGYFGQGTPAGISADVWTLLTGAALDQQPERITVSLENMSIDDISKLWSVLGEKYRPSAAYLVTVVLVQPDGPVHAVLPVTQPPIPKAEPLLPPALADVQPPMITWGATTPLQITGSNLLGHGTVVVFGTDATAAPDATSTALSVKVVLPATAKAGLQPVRIRHTAVTSQSQQPTTFDQSNPLALFVAPVYVKATVAAQSISVELKPDVGDGQSVQLRLIGPSGSFALDARPRAEAGPTVTFDTGIVPADKYLAQVNVDGADTELTQPAAGKPFSGPTVTIP